MKKFYTITLISLLMLFVSVRSFALYYHTNPISDISYGIAHVYADDGGDGGGDGGDGGGDDDGGDDDGEGDIGDDGSGDDGGEITPPPVCPIVPQENRTIVNIDINPMVANSTQGAATKGPVSAFISAGNYDITLVSYDDHSNKPGQIFQTQESWYLNINDESGAVIETTAVIADLPDNEDYKTEQVETNFLLNQNAVSITALHSAFKTSNPHSIVPLCVAFDKIISNPPAPVTADLKVNDSDGPVTISDGDSFGYSWISTGATTCSLNSPTGTSTIALSGAGESVNIGHPWYPSISTSTTLTLVCANESSTSMDSVVVQLDDVSTPPPSPDFSVILTPTPSVGIAPLSVNLKADVSGSIFPTSLGSLTYVIWWNCSNSDTSFSCGTPPAPVPDTCVSNSVATICRMSPNILSVNVDHVYTALGTSTPKVWAQYAHADVLNAVDMKEVVVTNTVSPPSPPSPPLPPPPPPSLLPEPDVSLTADPGTIDEGATSTLSWTSSNTNICNANWTTATSTSGSQTVTPISTTSYSITCGNGIATSSATTTISVNISPAPTNGGGGGGGGGGGSSGGGGGGSSSSSGGVGSSRGSSISPSLVSDAACFYLRDYMRRDFDNDPIEVLKLQGFLRNFEGHREVTLTGVFDQATFDAVSAFQMKYFSDILEPWGHTAPTGYVYILTLKKINEIYCQRLFPLNQSQVNEIIAFRALIESLRAQGVNVDLPPSSESGSIESEDNRDLSTTTPPLIPVVGEAEFYQGQNFGSLAAAIFALPDTLFDAVKCLYEFLLILIVLYILGNVLKDVLYKNVPENLQKRFFAKWMVIDTGIALAIVLAYIMQWWCIISPLILALIVSSVWTLTYSRHNSIRASIKSWYLVASMRIKSLWKNARVTFKKKFGKHITEKSKIVEKKETESVIILPPLISKRDK